MQASVSIEEKLFGQHESFLRYCQEAGKKVVDELDREDFIAYRAEYSVPREQVEQIKKLLDFQEQKTVEEISSTQNIFEVPETSFQTYFEVTDLSLYENILLDKLNLGNRIRKFLRQNYCNNLAELLKHSIKSLTELKYFGTNFFGKSSIRRVFNALNKFFKSDSLKNKKVSLDNTEIKPIKNSSPQDISVKLDDSLQKFFNVDDLVPYENIFIADLDFNGRVYNCLKSNGYKTLAELLKSSQQKLSGFRNFGQGSFDNLISTLKKFFDSRRKKIPAKTLHLVNEELDEFLREAALNHDPQVDLIISAFEKFSDLVMIKSAFHNLPEEFRDKRVRPFLLACSLEKNNLFVVLPENLTVAELPEYLVENSLAFQADELKNFSNELNFDVRDYAQKVVPTLFKNERELEIVRRRAGGATLEQVGKEFGVTRERVRQMESKPIVRFNNCRADLKKFFYFIHALTDEKFLLTLDDMKKLMDAEDAKIIYFLASKTELLSDIFHFDKERNAFVFNNGTAFDETELIKNLPDVMDEKSFNETIVNLAYEKIISADLVRASLDKFYNRSGKLFHRGRLTLTFECGYVLKERFPNGYKIADESFYSRFVRYIQEIFDENTSLTQRNLDAKIGTIGFLCDRGKYIHPDFVHISPEIMERVKNFIDNSDRTAIFYKEIFESLKNIFGGTQITNHYFLQGAIKFYNLPYTLRKDYLTKASEIDMGKEFDSFVAERGEVSAQEIKENFISFKDFNIAFLAGRCPEIIRTGDGILIHATHLDLHEEDFEPIKNFLHQNCSTPINSRVLFDVFFERFTDFMTRNEIQNHNKLFGVLQYMFRDDFNFSRPYISMVDIENINNKKFLLRLLESAEEIEIEDLIGICEENGVHYVTRTYLIDSLRPDFVRVDEFTLMRPESIGVTDEIISMVVESIQSAIERNGGWQVAQTFEDYEWLPQLEIPWNSFLLESVILLADNAPYRLKIPSTSTNFSSTIFLSDEFAGDDFQSFLLKILSTEHTKEPFRSEKEIFNWLKEQGLCNKKLPKFLEGGRAFELLGE